jgi:hypothetical protein
MVMYLNLGVLDVPYSPGPVAPRRAVARIHKGKLKTYTVAPSGQQTTGDVAEILEDKYNILEAFSSVYGDEIADALANSLAGAIEDMFASAPVPENPYAGAEAEIEQGMKLFLDLQELDGANGVPTKAALRGVNHRLAYPYAKGNPARPSFIDTGLMQANYRAWTETE